MLIETLAAMAVLSGAGQEYAPGGMQERVQEHQAVGIRPLQIVHHHHQRAAGRGHRADYVHGRLDQPLPGFARVRLLSTGLLLTHDPGDGLCPSSVYEVQTAQLTPQRRDDLGHRRPAARRLRARA